MPNPRLSQTWYWLDTHEALEAIVGCARLALLRALSYMDPAERDWMRGREGDGGVLAVAFLAGDSKDFRTTRLGHFTQMADIVEYTKFAHEKLIRLFSGNDPSCWSTRDGGAGKYGGGIQLFVDSRAHRRLGIAISGFTEHWDEAICVAALALLELISWEQIEEIERISDNPHIQTLLDALGISVPRLEP